MSPLLLIRVTAVPAGTDPHGGDHRAIDDAPLMKMFKELVESRLGLVA